MHRRIAFVVVALTALLIGVRAYAVDGPQLTLDEGGRTFVYRSRPGESPSSVAAMFGIPANETAAFLSANGIGDATRVASGFVYRVPNRAGREVAEHAAALERDNGRLSRALAEATEKSGTAVREAREARDAATAAESRASRLEGIERWWRVAEVAILLLLLGVGSAVAVALAATRRQAQAERFARSLATELDEKKRSSLHDRQESGRRIIDLENRVRELESKLGPRVVVTGRSS
jgi:hypothetical protein